MNAIKKPHKRIGDQLIDMGIISRDQLKIALLEQKRSKGQIGEILVQLGFLTEAVLNDALRESFGQSDTDFKEIIPDADALNLISKSLAKQLNIVPVSYQPAENKLVVAISDIYDIITLDKITTHLPAGMQVEPMLAGKSEIDSSIDQFYGYELSIDGILNEIETGQVESHHSQLQSNEYSHPTVRLVDAFIMDAVKQEASDIHFEPEEGFLRVRYRIDGVLRQIRSLHKKYWPSIVVRLKVLANMNIAETRAPQDGHISLKIHGRQIDFRVASQPTLHGENVVLRILDRNKSIIPLDDLDMPEESRNTLKLMMARPEGIILVTGPTGSGKTTTLYSLISYLNDETVNIMTLEDPVEYPINMIRQSSLNPAVKMDFAGGIRSLMRQDPDIILVGEMRDLDTASMGFRAAMTGHQVFSTLHTNSAIGAIPRLLDIGVSTDVLSGNIIGIVGQRLIRKLCPACKKPDEPTKIERKILGVEERNAERLYRTQGCNRCNQSGFKGRIALMEVLKMDPEIDEAISQKKSLRELNALVKNKGFRTLADDGIARVMSGETTLDELSRVVDLTSRLSS